MTKPSFRALGRLFAPRLGVPGHRLLCGRLNFHQNSLANQTLLLGQKFEHLRSLYMELDQIQNFLLNVGTQYQMEYKANSNKDSKDGSDDGKANQLFYIGSSQNLLAAVVSLICQKYQLCSPHRDLEKS